MNGPITHDDVEQLLGAYALDAVDPDELIAIRDHIASCPRCATEVAEHQQVAGLLANSGGDAPAHLWDRIATQIEQSPPIPESGVNNLTDIWSSRRLDDGRTGSVAIPKGHRRGRVVSIAAAAAVVVIASLGVEVSRLNGRVGQLQSATEAQGVAQAAQAAFNDPHGRHIALTAAHTTGPDVAEIVLLPSGSAFLVDSQLPKLPGDRTYQLWGRRGDQLISLGLLGTHPIDVAFWVDPSATVSAFAITDEHAGGVITSTQVPVAVSPTVTA